MRKKALPPLVREAYQLSLTSAPLHAVEASINLARVHIGELPVSPERTRLEACMDACWMNCMMIFSSGRAVADGSCTPALEAAIDHNTETARQLLTEAATIAIALEKRGKPVADTASAIEKALLTCGQLVSHLFAAGGIEGHQTLNGIEAKLPNPNEHKTI